MFIDPIIYKMPESLDHEKFVIATYYCATKPTTNMVKFAAALAIEQTCGTWLKVPGETPEVRERAIGRVVGVYETPAYQIGIPDTVTERHFIVRIAWVFGLNGKNFIKTMLSVGKKHDTVRVVCDQIGTPTYTLDLARLLVDMIETEKYGYYHATNEGGYISWYDFTCEIYRQAGYNTQVIPVTTEEYGLSKAARPFNSRLDKSKLTEMGFAPLPDWRDALTRYLKEIEV